MDVRAGRRLLGVDPSIGATRTLPIGALVECFRPGDLLVLNDSATLPASLWGESASGGAIELRLTGGDPLQPPVRCVAFGAGGWQVPTERRAAPGPLSRGDRLAFPSVRAPMLTAQIARVGGPKRRLVWIRFDGSRAQIAGALYSLGRPIQYAHESAPLELRDVQTAFATRPWSAEQPSATGTFSLAALDAIRARGVEVAWLTHAAGISSSGDPALDAQLPLSERYSVPAQTVAAVQRAQRAGRVVAGGTSVVRALESIGPDRFELAGPVSGVTRLRIGPSYQPQVVRGLLSGIHEPGESHHRLMAAFADPELLLKVDAETQRDRLRPHERGDRMLILDGILGSVAKKAS